MWWDEGGLEEGIKGTEGGKSCNSISNKAQFLKGLSLKSECNLKKSALSVSPKFCPQSAVMENTGKRPSTDGHF